MLTRTLVAGIIDVRVGWRSNHVAKHTKDLAVRADLAKRGIGSFSVGFVRYDSIGR